jgi:glycosyltransferase involved in cell wall biosynthesis|uniref:Glycosyltransferase 2-like domain-containing protein n=1 Tax=viral metagenome TaxID=1070528 RepID=A0A6C0IK25_9ZZZZ
MGKKKTSPLPMVSVCTPTFNRRPFIQNMFQCFRNQEYPKSRIEWIIVDDGTDKIHDLVKEADIPQIKYYEVNNKMPLGAKRNFMHQQVTGDIIVYMDDDDYYPPDRISHAVETLTEHPQALCAGSSEIYIYFKEMDKMIQCGPYGPNHATAGTFAFRKELLKQTKYEDHAALAEERAFLKDYTVPFVQLDPMKTILVFSHEHNTFDKRKMFQQQQDPRFFKESGKVVNNFIRRKSEKTIKKFFMDDIDNMLKYYEPGHPTMKPDVLKQIKEIEAKREEMKQEMIEKDKENGPIILNRPEGSVQLSNKQVVEIIKQQQNEILQLKNDRVEFDRMSDLMKIKLVELHNKTVSLRKENEALQKEMQNIVHIPPTPPSFLEPNESPPINKSDPVLHA